VKKLFTVPGRSFNPSPAVDSVIIQFARKDSSISQKELTEFFDLVRACFKQRRKTIYNNLREYLQDADKAKEVLDKAGIEQGRRAQQLSVDELRRIYEELI
jgi:16S rRNA (adenine1518-N6/adenine1519-N6)-dimethyltransferase